MALIEKHGFDEIKRKIANGGGGVPERVMLRRLHKLGLDMTTHARTVTPGHSSGGYNDQTGNLRSSIGYRIYKDGVPVEDGGFQGGYGAEGGAKGEAGAKSALNLYSLPQGYEKGWTIVIVAGMSYASAVESGHRKTRNGRYYEAKGYNVLKLTGDELKKRVQEMQDEINGKN